MTDIVERLRDWPRMTPVACTEAADEIERLRRVRALFVPEEAAAEIERLREQCDHWSDLRDTDIETMRAEIERLRNVLDAARLILKNRDQRPNEMKVYEAIRAVLGDWRST